MFFLKRKIYIYFSSIFNRTSITIVYDILPLLTIFPLKNSVDVGSNTSEHAYVSWIVEFYVVHRLVEAAQVLQIINKLYRDTLNGSVATSSLCTRYKFQFHFNSNMNIKQHSCWIPPILGSAKEVSFPIVSPDHRPVDLLQRFWQSKFGQWFWITWLEIVGVENVVHFANEEHDFLIRPLVNCVHVIDALRQIKQTRDLRWISLVQSLVADSPQILQERHESIIYIYIFYPLSLKSL